MTTPNPLFARPAAPDFGTLLSTVQARPSTWLWTGRVPRGCVTVLDGDPGLGKSLLTLDLAAHVTTGRPMPFGGPPPAGPAGVVLLNAEDDLHATVLPRLVAAGGEPGRVLCLSTLPGSAGDKELLQLPADLRFLRRAVRSMGAALVLIDPLMAWLGPEVNTASDQDVRRALHPLACLAQETGAAVVVVRHLNKAAGKALYRGGGSIGIVGAARSALLAGADPDDPGRRVLASVKCNLAPPPPSLGYTVQVEGLTGAARVSWLGPVRLTCEDLVEVADNRETRSELAEAEEFLLAALAAGPVRARDVLAQAAEAGISTRTLKRAKQARQVRSELVGGGAEGAWYWSLPGAAASG